MSGFGGAVKLTGESEYRKALSQITQSLKVVSSEMKATSTAFAAGEKSEKELAQSSQNLAKALDTQKSALATLKSQLSQMQAEYTKSGASHQQLLQKYEQEKAKLEEIGKTLGTSSQEYKDQEKVVAELSQEVTKSEKAYDAQGKAINDMRIKTANAETTCNQTAQALDNLGKEAEESGKDAEKAGEGFTVFKGVLANLATQAISATIDGLKQLGGAFIDVGKQAIDGYAQFEQLEGGVKKIFGDDLAQEVMENADKAFKTAGMSANEYMDTVTGFSATLLQGLGDDTSKAASYADTAIRNMSDNANTFGTDISMIQNAYQGFAKGNFTMLDNLKLGYGGTQAEMARLINESGVLGDSMEVTAETVKNVPFHQMIEAIDVTQERMGIMGTTAKEAAGTIEGSTGSMKAAWENLLTGMANENADFAQLASDFIGTLITPDGTGGVLGTLVPRISNVITGISTALQTLLPQLIQTVVPLIQENLPIIIEAVQGAIETIVSLLPEVIPIITDLIPEIASTIVGSLPTIIDAGIQIILGLIDGISDAIPQLIAMMPKIIKQIVDVLVKNLPKILETGVKLLKALVDGLNKAIPELISYLPEIITTISTVLIQNLPQIIETAVQIIMSLITGLSQSLPQIAAMTPEIITTIVDTLIQNLPQIIESGVNIVSSLIDGLMNYLGNLASAAQQLGSTILDTISGFASQMYSVGSNIVSGIWNGISGSLGWIKNMISGWVGNVKSFLKSLFGIHSPSTVMRDEVGKNIALGIAEGIKKNTNYVKKSVTEISKIIVTEANTRLGELKKANKIAETDEINFWETIVGQVKKGSAAYRTAMANLSKAKNDLKEDVAKVSQTFVNDVKEVNAELTKNIKELKETYKDTVNKRQEEIVGSLKLFETVKYNETIAKNDLLKNLKDQVKALDKWDNTLDALRGKIKNKDLLDELESQGVSALPILEQINSMSEAELATYEKLYKKKQKIAKERAVTENQELLAETNAQIEKLKNNAQKQIEGLKNTYLKNLKALGVEGNKESQTVGKQIASGIQSGFTSGMKGATKQVKNDLNAMLKAIKKQLKIQSPSKVYENEIGDNLAKGIGVGFDNEMKLVTQQMKDAIPTSFDVASGVTGARYTSRGDNISADMVNAFKAALSQVNIVLDDEVAGAFVDKTVTKLVYST